MGVDDSLYVLKDGRFQRIAGLDHKPLGLVVAITEENDGNIWAACAGSPRKLVRIRDLEVREEFPTSQVPAARTLAPDPQGGIWIATTTGDLARFRNGAVEKFALNLKGNPYLRRIVANANGSVLAASEDGLVGLRQGKVQRMTTENGLPCSAVFSFVEDKEKRWWLYTDCGVLELADSELQRWWSDPGALVQTRIYDRLDGAQPNAPYFNSAAYSPDGRVWFPNGQVVQMVDPSRLSRKAPPAPTYIESVIVDRREFAATENLGLAPRPRDLQIDYTSPAFTIPQKVKFRYRLDPFDSDWHDAGTRRQAFYTDLPPGNYTFRVIAANSDGVWNETPAKLDFSIAPAYFQTNWFRALCAAIFLAMLWMAYRLRVRDLQRRFETTLEARVGERTRIARELHDTLLQSFHGLMYRFQAVLMLLPGEPAKARQELQDAVDQASHAITEGRDAVQGLRASATEMNDLADAIREVAAEASDGEAASVRINVEGTPRKLHPIVRDEVFRIADEALRNAFRHANAKQVEVRSATTFASSGCACATMVRASIRRFWRRAVAKAISGCAGCASEDAVGGKLRLWSALDTGTEIELTIPGSRAYRARARPGRGGTPKDCSDKASPTTDQRPSPDPHPLC